MPEVAQRHFLASDPSNQVLGSTMLSLFQAMEEDAEPILKAHKLQNVDATAWYPQQVFLDVFNDIFENYGNVVENLVAIGMAVVANSAMPPQIQTLEDALNMREKHYASNNHDKHGGWKTRQNGPNDFTCISSSPFPSEFEYGLLYGICRKFVPNGYTFTIHYDVKAAANKSVSNPVSYHITWKLK